MTFRVAAKTEVDAYFPILWFNNVSLSMEVEQAKRPLCLFLSLLAVFTSSFIMSPSGRTIYADAQLQKGFTRRVGAVLHRAS